MSPALVLEDLPRPSFSSGGLWAPSKAGLPKLNNYNTPHKPWSSPQSQSQSQPLPQPQPQQQKQQLHLGDDLADDINTLWNTRWKHACRRRQHPFQDASYLDFAPVFAALTLQGVTSARSPAYTQTLAHAARTLADSADAYAALDRELASRLLLRACALLRVARYPSRGGSSDDEAEDDLKREARALQQTYHRRAVGLLPSARDSPAEEVLVPHVRDLATSLPPAGAGVREAGKSRFGSNNNNNTNSLQPRRRPHIPLLVRVPAHTLYTGAPCPAAVVLARDRTGATRACEAALARGYAAVVVECHATAPAEVARVCASVLDWMAAVGFYDTERVVALGEGDAAMRAVAAAPACGARLRGVVAYVDGAAEEEVMTGMTERMETGEDEVPRCHVLTVVSGARETVVASNGLWTPAGEDREGQELVTLCAYGPGSRECVGALETTDADRAHDWVADVMEGIEPQIPGCVAIPTAAAAAKASARGGEGREESKSSSVPPMPEWFSREGTPPDSDVEMASACGSSP